MTTLYLIRHGNTFTPDQTSYWVGKGEDLPLVEKGLEQAEALQAHFISEGVSFDHVYSASLQRTQQTAQSLGKPITDERLDEINYGVWGGKNDAEIAAKFGRESMEGWQQRSAFPPEGQWVDTLESVTERVDSFYHDILKRHPGETVAVVSSNGVLRYFLRHIPGAFEQAIEDGTFKMKTGGYGVMKDAQVVVWNVRPGL